MSTLLRLIMPTKIVGGFSQIRYVHEISWAQVMKIMKWLFSYGYRLFYGKYKQLVFRDSVRNGSIFN